MGTAKFCASCGRSITTGSSVCGGCGAAVLRSCPACGAENRSGNRFCEQCGAAQRPSADDSAIRLVIPARLAAISATPVPSERREVTVVFVDASNFTALSNRLDSEDVYTFIDEAMRLLVDVVAEYDGTIDKFTGDGLMALFGAPAAHENDAERAVRAAWEMQRVMQPFRERLRAERGFDFRIRIGVHTGEVVAGRIGNSLHAEYTVIGDTVNLASRLQAATDPDTVLVSAMTHERTAWSFHYETVPALTLKGISAPVTAYRLQGLRPYPAPQRGLPGLHVPMIGREQQFYALQQGFKALRAGEKLQVAIVTGAAGVGKTRLVRELSRWIGDSDALVLESHCSSLGRAHPLSLAADLIRSVLGLTAADPPHAHVEAVHAYAARKAIPADEIAPYLLSLLGITDIDRTLQSALDLLDEEMLQQQTHVAVRRILTSEAQARPMVVILDDLHWIDSASRDLFEYIIQSCGDERLFFVLTARDNEPSEPLQSLIEAANAFAEEVVYLKLEPLDLAHTRLLVESIIPGDSASLRELRKKIAPRCEGNPFYLEELVRALIDQGGLEGSPGSSWNVTPIASQVLQDVPPTLRALILARFDRLSREPRRILQNASVLGRVFPVRLLQRITEAAPGEIAPALQDLVSKEFLRDEMCGLEKGFGFHHALVQEAVHGTLLKRDRQELHLLVAQAIEQGMFRIAGDKDELLAYHYAGSTTPEKAIPYLIAAAEYAARRYAHDAAIDRCSAALSAIGPGSASEDALRTQLILGRSLRITGRYAEARGVLETAIGSAYDVLKDQDAGVHSPGAALFVDLLRELADVKVSEGVPDEAYMHLDEAALIAATWDDEEGKRLRYALRDRMAWVRFRQGQLDEALLLAGETARALSEEQTPDPVTLASLYNTVGGVLWQYGKREAAAEYVRKSLGAYHKIGYLLGKANAHTNLGILHYAQGQWRESAASFEKSDFIRRETGCMIGRAGNLHNLGMLRMALGDHDGAKNDLETALRVSRQLGEPLDILRSLLALAHVAILQLRFSDATKLLDVIATEHASKLLPIDLAQVGWLTALIVAHRQSPAEGIAVACDAVSMARESGAADVEVDCMRVLGILYARDGRYDDAKATLQSSVDLAGKMNDPYRRALALVELGRLPNVGERRALIDEAANHFAELGASFDLDRALSAESDSRAARSGPPDVKGRATL